MGPQVDSNGKKLTKAALKKLERKRKDDLRNSDSSMSDSEGSDEGGEKVPFTTLLRQAMRETSKAFARSLVDYGPPYRPWKDEDIEPFPIVDCCADMNISYVKLHRLLNARVDPNIPDDEDFYNRGMHYCGRHLHFLAARMLRRAGAEINVVNEWGQSPLHLVCMNVQVMENDQRGPRQIKFVQWFIDQGINIHLRDKGGNEPLDFACMSNNMPLIELLIEQGARFRRDNYVFRGKRKPLLENISDPEVYKFVREHIMEEEDSFQAREAEKKRVKEEAEYDKNVQRNLESLAKKKVAKEQKQKEKLEFETKMAKKAAREKSIQTSMDSLTKAKKERDRMFGEWVPDEQRNWHWKGSSQMASADEVSAKLHGDSVRLMKKLHSKNKKAIFEERWRAMGGGGEIEVPWSRSQHFEVEGITDEAKETEDVSVDISDDLAYRDENDDILEGESLGSLMDGMGMN